MLQLANALLGAGFGDYGERSVNPHAANALLGAGFGDYGERSVNPHAAYDVD